jgi:hypothetical protein
VWKVFSDISSFKEWNPFIKEANGELEVGSEIQMVLQPPGGRAMNFHPKVLSVVLNKEVSWQGHIPGVFTGTHRFTLEPIGTNRTRFRQHSEFQGIAARFAGSGLVEGGRAGFEEMERALKERVERLA